MLGWLLGVLGGVRGWLQPYWVSGVRPVGGWPVGRPVGRSVGRPVGRSSRSASGVKLSGRPANASRYRLQRLESRITSVEEGPRPGPAHIFWYHDDSVHQVLAYIEPGTGFMYRGRNDARRRKLRPLLYPRGVVFDRTHLIPIGYHGSECSPELVVGWCPDLNKGVMNDFEQRAKGLGVAFWWFVEVERLGVGSGCRLVYRLVGVDGFVELGRLVVVCGGDFVWL